jgi:acetylglutamate kinase
MTTVHPLKAAAPYLKAYRDQVFVVKLGGELLDEPAALDALCAQLALMWHLGIRLVLVHGGGSGLDQLSAELGLAVTKVAGRRVTDGPTLRAATMVLAGEVHTRLLARLRAVGLPAVGLSGVDAGLLTATKRPVAEVDYGFVGDLQDCDPAVLLHLLKGGFLPVVAPLSGNDAGEVFNTNADTVAAAVASALGATKLIFTLSVPGLLKDATNHASLVPHATVDDLAQLEASGAVGGGMKPKLAAVRLALGAGVARVHLVSGFLPDALLSEIFTNEGSGTLIEAVPTAAGVLS